MPHSLDRLETLYGKFSEAVAEARTGGDFLGCGGLWIDTDGDGAGPEGCFAVFFTNPGPFHSGRPFMAAGLTGALIIELELEITGCFR
jgi:hypothetical protein